MAAISNQVPGNIEKSRPPFWPNIDHCYQKLAARFPNLQFALTSPEEKKSGLIVLKMRVPSNGSPEDFEERLYQISGKVLLVYSDRLKNKTIQLSLMEPETAPEGSNGVIGVSRFQDMQQISDLLRSVDQQLNQSD